MEDISKPNIISNLDLPAWFSIFYLSDLRGFMTIDLSSSSQSSEQPVTMRMEMPAKRATSD